jgi:hypothetical protein
LRLIAVQNGEEVEIDEISDEAAADAEWVGPRFLKDDKDCDSSSGELGFDWSFDDDVPNGRNRDLWLYAEESGNPENAAEFVCKFLKRFRAGQSWSLTWATTCSKPRVGAFSGGAVFVTPDKIEWNIDCDFFSDREESFQRRQQSAQLAQKATKLGIEPCDLVDLVRDEADRSAAAINNDGLGGQILYLVEQLGVEEAERQIEQAVVTRRTNAEDDATA